MSKEETTLPVYSFLGYRLLEVKYNRILDGDMESFTLSILDFTLSEDSIYVITFSLKLKFENNEESEFIFNAGFEINDTNWYESINENQIQSIFIATVFPYIRQKVNVLTDDYRGGVVIPIIDLKNKDISNGITYTKN